MTVSFRPTTPMTDYTSWASPKHLMCICFPHAPHAQRVLPLRQCVHKRRLAKRFSACTVGTACNCGRQTLPSATEALVYRGRAG